MTEYEYWYWICQSRVLTHEKLSQLFRCVEKASEVFHLTQRQLQTTGCFNSQEIELFLKEKAELETCLKGLLRLENAGVRFVPMIDPSYPDKLRSIYQAPFGLYVKGLLPQSTKPSVAIVGARECTHYGQEMAHYFARELSSQGVQIISGMARGIDTQGHWGALEGAKAGYAGSKAGDTGAKTRYAGSKKDTGATFAVLGCGVDICYPAQNQKLYDSIIENGGIVSEFPLGTPPLPKHFPRRNRLISGLSDGVLVIEARTRSGSLITADLALEQGRDVWALPGRLGDKVSEGCNWLIYHGAGILQSPADVLEQIGYMSHNVLKKSEKEKIRLDKGQKLVYSCMDFTPKHLDDIINESGAERICVMESLLKLQLSDLVCLTSHNYYAKKCK